MRLLPDAEQRAFAGSLDAMLTAADTPSLVRDFSRGDRAAWRALWSRVAEAGVFSLAVPEEYGGLGALPVELAVAFVELGRHAVPGPLVETVAAAALLAGLDDPGPAERLLPALASGESTVTLATGTYALDADAAEVRLAVTAGTELRLAPPPESPEPGPGAPAPPPRIPPPRAGPWTPPATSSPPRPAVTSWPPARRSPGPSRAP